MSKGDLYQRLDRASEITLNVKGGKSAEKSLTQIWPVHEGRTLYPLPVQGTDTIWYKNFQANPTLKIFVSGGAEIPAKAQQ